MLNRLFLMNKDKNPVKTINGGEIMSPKELLYIEDALGHEKYLKSQCQKLEQGLTDEQLKQFVLSLASQHESIFNDFYQLL